MRKRKRISFLVTRMLFSFWMSVCLDEVPLDIRVAIAEFAVHSEEGFFGQSNITYEDRTVKDPSKSP